MLNRFRNLVLPFAVFLTGFIGFSCSKVENYSAQPRPDNDQPSISITALNLASNGLAIPGDTLKLQLTASDNAALNQASLFVSDGSSEPVLLTEAATFDADGKTWNKTITYTISMRQAPQTNLEFSAFVTDNTGLTNSARAKVKVVYPSITVNIAGRNGLQPGSTINAGDSVILDVKVKAQKTTITSARAEYGDPYKAGTIIPSVFPNPLGDTAYSVVIRQKAAGKSGQRIVYTVTADDKNQVKVGSPVKTRFDVIIR